MPYAVAAQWFATQKVWGWSDYPDRDAATAASYVKRALELSKGDALILAYAGNVMIICMGDHDFGGACLEEAIRYDPNLAVAWTWAGWGKITQGEHNTALGYFERSLRLSPLDPRNYIAQNGMAAANFFLSQYDESARWTNISLRQQPDYLGSLRIGAFSHALLGQIEEAQRFWSRVKVLAPNGVDISDIASRIPYRRAKEIAKIEQAYRILSADE